MNKYYTLGDSYPLRVWRIPISGTFKKFLNIYFLYIIRRIIIIAVDMEVSMKNISVFPFFIIILLLIPFFHFS